MSITTDISHNGASARGFGNTASWTPASGINQDFTADESIRALQKIGVTLRFARNETIFNEGDDVKLSYKVVSGVIRLCKHMSDGRRQIADFVLPGDYCGLFDSGEHRFTAEAASDVVVIAFPQRQIETLGETSPALRKKFMSIMTQRLTGLQDHLVMLGRQTAKERVVSFLLMLADRVSAEEGEAVELPMTRQDMADYLGLTIETVCRVLSELKRKGTIGLPNLHQMVVSNMDALHALTDGDE